MSHILSFKVEGLAGREKPIEVVLNRDVNIFFGFNGSGKTSLLKILHAAMANETDVLDGVPFTAAEIQIYSLNYQTVFTRSIKKKMHSKSSRRLVPREIVFEDEIMRVEGRTTEKVIEWTTTPASPKEAATARWAHQYLPTSRLHVSQELLFQQLLPAYAKQPWLTEEMLDIFFARSVDNLWNRYSSQVLKSVRTAQEQGLASILRAVISPKSATTKQQS